MNNPFNSRLESKEAILKLYKMHDLPLMKCNFTNIRTSEWIKFKH